MKKIMQNKILILWGKGEGKTKLSAFDKALKEAGIHNHNLIKLSSIIPPNSDIVNSGSMKHDHSMVGSIKYVVMARQMSDKRNCEISAGLGWTQSSEGGIFIESNGEFDSNSCKIELENGLMDMMSSRKWNWNNKLKTKVISHKVKDNGCVVVLALYTFL